MTAAIWLIYKFGWRALLRPSPLWGLVGMCLMLELIGIMKLLGVDFYGGAPPWPLEHLWRS